MAEVKLSGKPLEQRIADRLRNSGGENADVKTKHGDGPTRVFHNLHVKGQGAAARRVDLSGGVKGGGDQR